MPDPGPSRWARPSIILVATDLGDLDRLMPFALQQAHQSDARIILLHVLGAGAGIAADPVGMPYYDPAAAIDFAIKTLEPWRTLARTQEIPCDAIVREGYPAQQIIAAARQFKADRILLGTRSRSKVSKLLLGSVAEQVLRSVNLPVITVGPEAHLEAVSGTGSQRVVLHATTLRETSSPSAALACEIAAAHQARLVLMHVLPPVDEMKREHLPTALDSTATRELQILAAETGANDLCCTKVETRIAHGHPAIEILAASVELNAGLIVLGSATHSIMHNLTHDRTVYRVLAHARCPVMTLRDIEEQSVPLPQVHDAISM
ncbi:universal stress protein [Occallatibacter savannae]|uniref:universal stress protein n=1 Tax=Occallatibacter savannae TaxID=1002691 RepID=UPI000D69D93A|nr:universal stress protein [Occallatibacter savannae]